MGENKQKHVTSQYSTSKYAIKHQAQNSGHYSLTSPFQSSREHKAELQAKVNTEEKGTV